MTKNAVARPAGVVCLWECRLPKSAAAHARIWRLIESYGVDDSGYACTPNKHAARDRCSYHRFLFAPGDADAGPVPLMGRAVTAWSVLGGVRLAALHPPAWVPWLAAGFAEELRQLSNWPAFLEGGHTLYLGTAREAEAIMFREVGQP